MHHDYHFATERNGTKDIFLNTPNQAAWFERYLTDWTGPKGRLGRMKFRMHGSVFPGDMMELRAVVTNVDQDDTGCGWAELDVTLARQPARSRRPAKHVSRCRSPTTTTRGPAAATRGARNNDTRTARDDGSRLHRRTGDAAGDSARRLREARVAHDRARGRRRPARLSRLVLDAARRARPARPHDPGGVRRLRHDDARRSRRLRGVRPGARAVTALRQLGALQRRARTRG